MDCLPVKKEGREEKKRRKERKKRTRCSLNSNWFLTNKRKEGINDSKKERKGGRKINN